MPIEDLCAHPRYRPHPGSPLAIAMVIRDFDFVQAAVPTDDSGNLTVLVDPQIRSPFDYHRVQSRYGRPISYTRYPSVFWSIVDRTKANFVMRYDPTEKQ